MPPAAEPEPTGPPEPAGKFAERAKRNHALVQGLRAEGRGLREIARHLGWGLHTVQRYGRAATWQELADGRWKGPRASKLDPFKPYLDQHAGDGHGSFTRLFREIKELGYDGSYSVVRNYLDKHRPEKAPLPEAPPTVRNVTNWLNRHPDSLTEDDKPRLKAILDHCPELQAASDQVRTFAGMITDLTGENLPAERACLGFVDGLPCCQDQALGAHVLEDAADARRCAGRGGGGAWLAAQPPARCFADEPPRGDDAVVFGLA
jgi:hypothetical protein